jgi:hypothetical protein
MMNIQNLEEARFNEGLLSLSFNQVVHLHELLAKHVETVAVDQKDPLRDILNEFAQVPPRYSPEQDDILVVNLHRIKSNKSRLSRTVSPRVMQYCGTPTGSLRRSVTTSKEADLFSEIDDIDSSSLSRSEQIEKIGNDMINAIHHSKEIKATSSSVVDFFNKMAGSSQNETARHPVITDIMCKLAAGYRPGELWKLQAKGSHSGRSSRSETRMSNSSKPRLGNTDDDRSNPPSTTERISEDTNLTLMEPPDRSMSIELSSSPRTRGISIRTAPKPMSDILEEISVTDAKEQNNASTTNINPQEHRNKQRLSITVKKDSILASIDPKMTEEAAVEILWDAVKRYVYRASRAPETNSRLVIIRKAHEATSERQSQILNSINNQKKHLESVNQRNLSSSRESITDGAAQRRISSGNRHSMQQSTRETKKRMKLKMSHSEMTRRQIVVRTSNKVSARLPKVEHRFTILDGGKKLCWKLYYTGVLGRVKSKFLHAKKQHTAVLSMADLEKKCKDVSLLHLDCVSMRPQALIQLLKDKLPAGMK